MVAPNPTRVRLYLAENAGEQRKPEHLARNPLGRLPVLELDDGSYLTESLPIIEYLEETHPEPPMIGADPRERSRVRELERIAEIGVLHPIARIVHATNSPLGMPPSPEVAAHFRGILPEGLALLDALLADGRSFVAGERPSIADCTLAAALQFARFGKAEIDPAFEHVDRWDAAYREREPAKAVIVL
jgi:glutathione S-transferase